MHLLTEIERYLRRTGTSPTRFGRDAARDPRLVFDLRRGRAPGWRITKKVLAYLELAR